MTYQGPLRVEDDDFQLEAARFVVRASEVAFVLRGASSYDGRFSIDHVARKTSLGNYVASNSPVEYTEYAPGDYRAEIRFDRVVDTKSGCEVEGEWHEGGARWTFWGKLEPFHGGAA